MIIQVPKPLYLLPFKTIIERCNMFYVYITNLSGKKTTKWHLIKVPS